MHSPVSQEVNRQNLLDLSNLLRGCEHFPFFGTLLGLIREGDIIAHDDDVDIYANIEVRQEVLDRLSGTEFRVDLDDPVNASRWFLQAKRLARGTESYVDIYFYEARPDLDCIVERWNFSGRWSDEENHIHIPRELIYPIGMQEFFATDIAMPADPVKCCAYLYGSEWRRPLMKRLGYSTRIANHAPRIEVNPDQFSEVVRRFYELDETMRAHEQQLAQKWKELIEANQRLVEAGEEIGRWQERTRDVEQRLEEMEQTMWWRTRTLAMGILDALKSPFKQR